MRVVEINMTDRGSTGKIMLQIANVVTKHHGKSYTFAKQWKKPLIDLPNHRGFGSYFENAIHFVLAKYTGLNGIFTCFGTLTLVYRIHKIRPDVIHLHNLHDFCVNFPLLFRYLKKCDAAVVWTLHDCWAFTGKCPHFVMDDCNKWQTGCYACPQLHDYPQSNVDSTKLLWKHKRKWFTNVPNMTLAVPSKWLAGLVRKSFLKDYPVAVINNGIDLSVFTPTPNDFKKRYGCEGKYMLLGVAYEWGVKKGLDVFVDLASRLGNQYQIVLIGTNDRLDENLPSNIISIHRTNDQRELAQIYSAADVFVNPTREEVLGLVNVEALACGTPVITFNTGGSPECIDETCGVVVPCGNIDQLELEIIRVCYNKPFSKDACVERAKLFDMNKRFEEYFRLYEDLIESKKQEQGAKLI